MLLATGDPTIANNIAVMGAGLAYFHVAGRRYLSPHRVC
jgi:hypothetical protein